MDELASFIGLLIEGALRACWWLLNVVTFGLPRRIARRLFPPPPPPPETDPAILAAEAMRAERVERERRARAMIGRAAIAESALRPGGTIRVDGEHYDAVAEIGYITAGSAVILIDHDGARFRVRPAPERA